MTEQSQTRTDGAYRGRRISWREFYRMRPDLKPNNDDQPADKAA